MIGHLKAEHRMGRNYLAHRASDAINAVLAAAGYNFHLLLKWLQLLLSRFLATRKTLANQLVVASAVKVNEQSHDAFGSVHCCNRCDCLRNPRYAVCLVS